jgi:hypothetical protein
MRASDITNGFEGLSKTAHALDSDSIRDAPFWMQKGVYMSMQFYWKSGTDNWR